MRDVILAKHPAAREVGLSEATQRRYAGRLQFDCHSVLEPIQAARNVTPRLVEVTLGCGRRFVVARGRTVYYLPLRRRRPS